MNYIFVDFEMEKLDCLYKQERKVCKMEIIEIGAVMYNDQYEEISSFKRYVKPQYSEHISDVIINLTGITDSLLEDKNSSVVEIPEFAKWCCSMGDDFKVYAWSESDLKQITHEMRLKDIPETDELSLVLANWNDLQKEFDQSLYNYRSTSLSNALDSVGITFDGRQHDALDDSRNTARLYREMSTSDEYKKDVAFVKSCIHDKSRGTGITLGDLIDFSAFQISA